MSEKNGFGPLMINTGLRENTIRPLVYLFISL